MDETTSHRWTGRELGLSRRQTDLVRLVACAFTNRDIATRLRMAEEEVGAAIRSCYEVIGVETRSEVIVWAMQNGFRPDIYLTAQGDTQGDTTTAWSS